MKVSSGAQGSLPEKPDMGYTGVDPGFSKGGGGGLTVIRGRMGGMTMAMGRVRARESIWELLPGVLNICS